MNTIVVTRQTALQHCRTCLRNLLGNVAYDMEETPNLINWLERLLPLVSLYRGEDETDYPHLVCLECYAKLRDFNAFHDSVCRATDVLDGIFDDATAAGDAAATVLCSNGGILPTEGRVLAQQVFDLNGIEYTNGGGGGGENGNTSGNATADGTTFEIKVFHTSEGESTDTCSETEGAGGAEEQRKHQQLLKQLVRQPPAVIKQESSGDDGLVSEAMLAVRSNQTIKSATTTTATTSSNNTTTSTSTRLIKSDQPAATNALASPATFINRKSYKCSKCERKFLDKYSCIMHIRHCQLIGHQDEFFECEICHKNYQKIGHLNRHKRMEHEDVCQLKCEYTGCNFIFRRNIFRQRHYEMFHQNETKKIIIDAVNSGGDPAEDEDEEDEEGGETNNTEVGVADNRTALPANNNSSSTTTGGRTSNSNNNTALSSVRTGAQFNVLKVETLAANQDLLEEADYIDEAGDETAPDTAEEGEPEEHDHDMDEDGLSAAAVDEEPEEEEEDADADADNGLLVEATPQWALSSLSKPYRGNCPICQEQFKLGKDMRSHIANVHASDLKYACDVCDKRFLYQSYLNAHTIAAHAAKTMPCSHCTKVFKTSAELRKHVVRIHHGVRPYECRFCATKFGVRASRDRHELIHTGEKPFVCTICLRTFSYAHSMKKHMASHEKGRLRDLETEAATKAL